MVLEAKMAACLDEVLKLDMEKVFGLLDASCRIMGYLVIIGHSLSLTVGIVQIFKTLLSSVNTDVSFPNSHSGRNLRMVSKLIKLHGEREKNRDVLYMKIGGFDHHFNSKISAEQHYPPLNAAIEAFYQELVAQGNLDKVTFILTSEFGRVSTLKYIIMIYTVLSSQICIDNNLMLYIFFPLLMNRP